MSHDNSANDPMNFVKNMWGNMGFSLPGMVTPTFDVEEIEQRVKDMKAVEGWLKMNLSMLQMTIQSLEMQCVTLNAVRTMSDMASSQTSSTPQNSATQADAQTKEAGGEALSQAAMWPWNLMQQMQAQMQQAASEQGATPAASEETGKDAAKRNKKT
jgi:division protein CdvB (Snf7/Vps24/ESCRT-III family)